MKAFKRLFKRFLKAFKRPFKGLLPHLIKSRSLEGVPGSPGQSQKEGQEEQGEVKELGGTPLAVLGSSGSPGLRAGSALGP